MKRLQSLHRFFCWLSVLLLWGCAATVYVNPALYGKYFGVVGLAFPGFVAFVLLMLVVSVLTWQRAGWICVLGLAACCGSLRDYCPVNLTSPPPKGCLSVMSYNVMSFGSPRKDGNDYVIPRYIVHASPDIVTMQEAFVGSDDSLGIYRYFRQNGYYFESHHIGQSALAVASHFPITGVETICRTHSNGAMAFTLRPSQRDSILVVCVHLQSMGLSDVDRGHFHDMVRKPEEIEAIRGKRQILTKIANASRQRALMADTIMHYLDRHAGEPVILMGDFNDTPVSYAHHQVCGRLTDAYRATANGIGRSFNRDAIYVRIDNIFCSPHWKPFACHVDGTVSFSDHYPIMAFLKPQ